MKTASIPSLRVEPELRQAAEAVLHENETLSSFVEQALRAHIARRRLQSEFLVRGLTARDEARRSNQYHSAEEVLGEIEDMLNEAEAHAKAEP